MGKSCGDRILMWLPLIGLSAIVIGLPIIFAGVWKLWILPVSIYGGLLLLFVLISLMLSKVGNFAFFPSNCQSTRRLDGQWAVVTGANSGTGYETAKELVSHGCNVIITCRSQSKVDATIQNIMSELKNNSDIEDSKCGKLDSVLADLCSKKSIDLAIEGLLNKNVNISILINNAGAALPTSSITEDGIEAMWQANYVAPFYMTKKLLNNIKASSKQLSYGRIVNVASMTHQYAVLSEFEAFMSDDKRGDLAFWEAESAGVLYGNTKCAVMLYTMKLQELLNEEKDDSGTSIGSYLWVTSLQPGFIDSGFYRPGDYGCIGRVLFALLYPIVSTFGMVTAKKGAQTSLHCALSDDNVKPGQYHGNCQPQATMSQASAVMDTQKDVLYQKTDQIWE